MKYSAIVCCIFALAVSSCMHSSPSRSAGQDTAGVPAIIDTVAPPADTAVGLSAKYPGLDQGWLPYATEIRDSLHSAYERPARSQYFLHDVTGDGKDELWIKVMSCEADAKTVAFALDGGGPRQILDGNGFHAEFFVFDGELVCVSCWMGGGQVTTYGYANGAVREHAFDFVWDDGDDRPRSQSPQANKLLEYWLSDSSQPIELKDL